MNSPFHSPSFWLALVVGVPVVAFMLFLAFDLARMKIRKSQRRRKRHAD